MKSLSAQFVAAGSLFSSRRRSPHRRGGEEFRLGRTTPERRPAERLRAISGYCSMCHGEGPGQPGTMALQAKYKGADPRSSRIARI